MEELPLEYNKNDYIETLTGNRVSKKSILCGSQNIRLSGKVKCLYLMICLRLYTSRINFNLFAGNHQTGHAYSRGFCKC